jgi:hypothetical protein
MRRWDLSGQMLGFKLGTVYFSDANCNLGNPLTGTAYVIARQSSFNSALPSTYMVYAHPGAPGFFLVAQQSPPAPVSTSFRAPSYYDGSICRACGGTGCDLAGWNWYTLQAALALAYGANPPFTFR